MTQLLNSGASPADITARILEGLCSAPAGAQSADAIVPRYGPCESSALRDRMLRAVASLGVEEVRSIVREQGHVEVTCELCCEQYQFTESDVLAYV
jgi:molecular chaperone Hsp33